MDEGDACVVGSRSRGGVDHLDALGLHVGQGRVEVVDLQGDVMDARALFGQKFCDGSGFWTFWSGFVLQDFEHGAAGGNFRAGRRC